MKIKKKNEKLQSYVSWEKSPPPQPKREKEKNMGEESSGYIFYEGYRFRNIQVHQLRGQLAGEIQEPLTLAWLAKVIYMYMYIHLSCTQHQSSVFHQCVVTPNVIENDHLKVVSSQFSHSDIQVGTSSNIKLTLLHLYNMQLKFNIKHTLYCSLLTGRIVINYKKRTHRKHQRVSKNTHN